MDGNVAALLAALGLPIVVALGFRYASWRAERNGIATGAGYYPRFLLGRLDEQFPQERSRRRSKIG